MNSQRTLVLLLVSLVALAQPGAAQKDEKKKWNIADPLGTTSTIAFDTSEGTWMNVDVSPDGQAIVFDLLGDLYVMPIQGSGSQPATRLTSGPAFDKQPRFSPDGKRVAYISDRDGLTNIWVMDPDGRNARQVSKESRWFINSPTWSPDGQYIFSRKHFVKERSLGAGEIWMHHVSGGDGLQVTEKTSWQKDAGEPAISSDGKYLYYSKDVTPGQNFEYNKDPYGVIYAIFRRDLTTGEERRLSGRPGGSITPRPSPDGRQLAFIRRVGLSSHLFLRDLATGEEWSIFDKLDKDLQEAWTIHGVYPQYGWTPDGKAIVIWGQGKISRVDTAARRGVDIPFTARVEQTINEALRFPQPVHPDDWPVKMLRDVTSSPDGTSVAYSALGRIYVKRMPDAAPRRLIRPPINTTQEASGTARGPSPDAVQLQQEGAPDAEVLEFGPSFSRDGSSLVYTTWSDAEHGRVRVARMDGGGVRDLVREPGHYTEASFSPDSKSVVYRSVAADQIRAGAFGENRGIFVVSLDAGASPRRVREQGTDPQFDHTGSRIYFRERRGEKFVLASVDLDGSNEVIHFQSDNATQIAPSPDGRWVAFAERYHAYIAAFPRSGRAIDLGPRAAAYPVARISRDAGMYLHWSGDSRRVHWALGPELFTRDLSETFAFLEKGLEKPDSPEPARSATEGSLEARVSGGGAPRTSKK